MRLRTIRPIFLKSRVSSWGEKNLVRDIRQAQASCEAVDKGLLCYLDRLYGLVVSLS